MKKLAILLTFAGLLFLPFIVSSAPYPLQEYGGGTGTNATSSAGQIPISTGSSTYTPATLTASGTVSIASASGSVTITGLGTTTTIQSVLNALSAAGLATYSSSTGVFTVSSSSLSLGTASHNNTGDFLSSSTVYVSSFNTRTGAVTLTSGDVTTALGFTPLSAAITTIDSLTNATQTFQGGTGIGVTTSSPNIHTITLNINNGSVQTCTSGGLANSLSATGTITCQIALQTLAGVTTSSIAINGTANEVLVATTTNSVTFSTPQPIGTSSIPQFAGLTVGTSSLPSGYYLNIVNNSVNGLQTNLMDSASSGYAEYVLTADTGTTSTNYGGVGIDNSNGETGVENPLDIFVEATNGVDTEACVNGATSSQCLLSFFIGGTSSTNLKFQIASSSITANVPLNVSGNVTSTGLTDSAVTSSIPVTNASGTFSPFSGSTCSSGFASSISATGTLGCAATSTSGGSGSISTSTALASGQVDFSTGTSTIGNDSNLTYASNTNSLDIASSSGSVVIGTSTNATNAYLTIGSTTYILAVLKNGDVGIGSSTAGDSLTVVNNGSAGNILGLYNSAGTPELKITNAGAGTLAGNLTVGSGGNMQIINGSYQCLGSQQQCQIVGNSAAANGGATGADVIFAGNTNRTGTSGDNADADIRDTFNPTSGSATFGAIEIGGGAGALTINQTSGANGPTFGIYEEPTLTSAYNFSLFANTSSITDNLETAVSTTAQSAFTINGFTYKDGSSTAQTVPSASVLTLNSGNCSASSTCTVYGDLIVNVTSTPASSTNSYGIYLNAPSTTLALNINGHIGYATTSVSVSSCGSTPSGSVVGSDNAGIITVGGSATACTLNFSTLWKNTPECTVTNQSMSVTNAMSYTVSTSTIAISQTGLSSDILDYQCAGDPF